MDYSLIPDQVAALSVVDVAVLEEINSGDVPRVDVERATLPRMRQHLQHSGQFHVRKAAAQRRIGRPEHLHWLETFGTAAQKSLDLGGNQLRAQPLVHIVGTSGTE